MAPKIFSIYLVVVLAGFSTATTISPSEAPQTVSTCTTSQVTVRRESFDHAWILGGSQNILSEIGWTSLLQTQFLLNTTTMLGTMPGVWKMQIRNVPKVSALFVCLNHTNDQGHGQVGIEASVRLAVGNYSLRMQKIPASSPHHPLDRMAPSRPVSDDFGEDYRCSQYYVLHHGEFTSSLIRNVPEDDIALVFKIHAHEVDIQQTTQSGNCDVPSFSALENNFQQQYYASTSHPYYTSGRPRRTYAPSTMSAPFSRSSVSY